MRECINQVKIFCSKQTGSVIRGLRVYIFGYKIEPFDVNKYLTINIHPYRQMVGYFFNNGFVAAVLHFELAVETFSI